jgi:hypothetical protein
MMIKKWRCKAYLNLHVLYSAELDEIAASCEDSM